MSKKTGGAQHKKGQKLTPDGRYTIEGLHNCGCQILRPLGASYCIISYCKTHCAAPDLLKSLEATLHALECYCATHKPTSKGACCFVAEDARAAIAKATGQEGR